MTSSRYLPKASVLAAMLALLGSTATAAPLAGGASSLVETYDDWGVVCQMQANAPSCVARQAQTGNQTKQTVLAVEIGKASDGGIAKLFEAGVSGIEAP